MWHVFIQSGTLSTSIYLTKKQKFKSFDQVSLLPIYTSSPWNIDWLKENYILNRIANINKRRPDAVFAQTGTYDVELQAMAFRIEEHSFEREARANCQLKQNIDTWLNRCLSRLSAWPISVRSRAVRWKTSLPHFLQTAHVKIFSSCISCDMNVSRSRGAPCDPNNSILYS